MKLDLPDDILRRAEISCRELRLAVAIQLYADRRIDHADACRIAEAVPGVLNRELASRDISVQAYPRVEHWLRRQAG